MGKFQENMVYSVYDICKILGCSNNKGYALVHEAYKSKNMFRVIKCQLILLITGCKKKNKLNSIIHENL